MSTQVSPVLNTNRLVLAVPSGSAESAIFEIHSDARTYEHRPDLTMKHARKPQHCAMNGSTNGRKTASDTSLFLARTRKARTPATSSASVSSQIGGTRKRRTQRLLPFLTGVPGQRLCQGSNDSRYRVGPQGMPLSAGCRNHRPGQYCLNSACRKVGIHARCWLRSARRL